MKMAWCFIPWCTMGALYHQLNVFIISSMPNLVLTLSYAWIPPPLQLAVLKLVHGILRWAKPSQFRIAAT